MSHLRVRWDRSEEGCPRTNPSIGESSVASFSNECAICLQDYRPNEVIVISDNPSCSHCYHRDCIVEYLIPFLEFEGKDDSNSDGDYDTDGSSFPPSLSTTRTYGDKGALCPRRAFVIVVAMIQLEGAREECGLVGYFKAATFLQCIVHPWFLCLAETILESDSKCDG